MTPTEREEFEERAAIIEYDGKLPCGSRADRPSVSGAGEAVAVGRQER